MFAPGTTPPALVDRISRDIASVAKRPEFTERHITSRGLDLVANTPAEFAAALRAEVVSTGEMVKAAGVKPE
jgi:tripartite-type tricarboxylate transporter receptor subunit TctC